ncbi:MAG: hypothetical protein P4L16_00750 [Chlamydiales bacterium]|nr:hypothetical protein [Chlamydiales bacterium]
MSTVALTITTKYYPESTAGKLYDVCDINGSLFAIFYRAMQFEGEANIDLENYSLVFLKSVEANKISIKAVNVIFLNSIRSRTDEINVKVSGKVILLGSEVRAFGAGCIEADGGFHSSCTINDQREQIQKVFMDGVREDDGTFIVDGLVETIDVLKDCMGERERISASDALQFLGVSI